MQCGAGVRGVVLEQKQVHVLMDSLEHLFNESGSSHLSTWRHAELKIKYWNTVALISYSAHFIKKPCLTPSQANNSLTAINTLHSRLSHINAHILLLQIHIMCLFNSIKNRLMVWWILFISKLSTGLCFFQMYLFILNIHSLAVYIKQCSCSYQFNFIRSIAQPFIEKHL